MQTIESYVHGLVSRALGEDSATALRAVRRLIDEEMPWIEARAVAHARSFGWSWGRIGRVLHRSRQSMRERYMSLRPTIGTPMRIDGFQDGITAEQHRMLRWMAMTPTQRAAQAALFDEPVAW